MASPIQSTASHSLFLSSGQGYKRRRHIKLRLRRWSFTSGDQSEHLTETIFSDAMPMRSRLCCTGTDIECTCILDMLKAKIDIKTASTNFRKYTSELLRWQSSGPPPLLARCFFSSRSSCSATSRRARFSAASFCLSSLILLCSSATLCSVAAAFLAAATAALAAALDLIALLSAPPDHFHRVAAHFSAEAAHCSAATAHCSPV